MKKNMKKLVIISILAFLIDLFTKFIISKLIQSNGKVIIVKNFFLLTNVKNSGAAFSILENRTPLLILTSLICLYIIYKMYDDFPKNKVTLISFSLLIGGILGNLYDRIIYSSVRDFLSFTFGSYNFPIFNMADTFIVVGVAMLLIYSMFGESGDKKNANNSKRIR